MVIEELWGSVEWDNRELKQFDIKSAISTMNQKSTIIKFIDQG